MPSTTTDISQQTSVQLWQQLAALVRLSLVKFWCQALPKDNGLLQLLRDEAEILLQTSPANKEAIDAERVDKERVEKNLLESNTLYQTLSNNWPIARDEPLAKFILDHELTLDDALLLTLLGEMERSHTVVLVVHQLQAPVHSGGTVGLHQLHPTVHLLESWLSALNPDSDFSFAQCLGHYLFDSKIIQKRGDGPIPLQQLYISIEFWALMTGQLRHWPACHLIKNDNRQKQRSLLATTLQQQIPVIANMLQQGLAQGVVLRGVPGSGRKIFTAVIAQEMGLQAIAMEDEHWQSNPALVASVRYGNWLPVLSPRLGPGESIQRQQPNPSHPMFFHVGTDGAIDMPGFLEITMPLPDREQRKGLWQSHLSRDELLAERVANALLSGPTIHTLASKAKIIAAKSQHAVSYQDVVQARIETGAENLRLLAQPDTRLVPRDAIVLPPLVESELDRFVERAQLRESLWNGLGTTLKQTNTAGVRALFVGESGTGKTLAASYIATRLGSPLYRVDLSAVMNKYIGESEKNLSAVLDMAAAGDYVLLFDEADSLFGKRTEGKETGERFANMLTHFLLTRIENHPGIVVLTSNNRERIDSAFSRRLDLIVEFPLPGFEERQQLWKSHLGKRGPGDEVYMLLASYCDFAGGQLRNVVLAAAAHAGDGSISSQDLLVGLHAEYRKLGRELPGKLNQLMHFSQNAVTQQAIHQVT
ncbi:ATP-dependent zinc metalloprotease FtsH [Thalassocella blandensis]|nr:ATP-dependent zinc metalloprotease FtsH [Thalassocella blandensis]